MRIGLVFSMWCVAWIAGAGEAVRHEAVAVTASSTAGPKYAAEKAVDGNAESRWASRAQPALPQWVELRYAEPVMIDTVYLKLADDDLYGDWANLELSFSEGPSAYHPVGAGASEVVLRIPARKTSFLRIGVTEVHSVRTYVGLFEAYGAHDPKRALAIRTDAAKPIAQKDLVIRGRDVHPCVNRTPAEVARARKRVETLPWAKAQRDAIVADAEKWMKESDAYWLSFLPEPGACYAYGFTACPICDGRTGTWHGARCSWDKPGQVACVNGHTLPDAEHPDAGEGYQAPDGRIHYFQGQFNAWATEQWTQYALPALTDAWLLTGDERYANRAALLLDALASIYKESTSGSWDYPSNPPSGRFARPWYQVARTLVKYVDYYDGLYHAPAMDEPSLRPGFTRRENIEQNMLMDGAYYCYDHAFAGTLHNGHADYLRGALAVGCLLDVPEFIRVAVEGPFSIHTMLANNIDRDGRYYESSLGYGIHARELYLTFADPLYNLRNAEYPGGVNLYDDPRFRAAILLPDTLVSLAGRRPNFGDSAPDIRYIAPGPPAMNPSDRDFLARLYARTTDEMQRDDYGRLLRWGTASEEGAGGYDAWALWHGAPLEEGGDASLPQAIGQRLEGSWVAGMKGMALLRLGTQAALLRYGPSLNHGDPDDLGLTYYAEGYQLTYDLGYGLGSTHAHVGWASSTVSHSIATVNETNQLVGDGSGGSLHWFADLPHVQAVEAESANSYSSEGVTEYRRALALVDGGYLVDVFHVTGGSQHDFGFAGMGTDLEPFGIAAWQAREGSLAEGFDWGTLVGADGDIKGYPNKPYWNPPPGNGYGFFKNLQVGAPSAHWGGVWTVPGEPGAQLKMHVLGDADEALIAHAPGLYPNKPDASYVMARRSGTAPLHSTFISVYEPFDEAPVLADVRRLGDAALAVTRAEGRCDVLLFGSQSVATPFGAILFQGDFAYLSGSEGQVQYWEASGATQLDIDGQRLVTESGVFVAEVVEVDRVGRRLRLSAPLPAMLRPGQIVTVENPAYSRSSAYPIKEGIGHWLTLDTGSLSLGVGRVWAHEGPERLVSGIPHEYARHVRRGPSRFFDGKIIRGERGGETRVRQVVPGSPMVLTVDDSTVFEVDERFEYLDIAPGDQIRIGLPTQGTGPVD